MGKIAKSLIIKVTYCLSFTLFYVFINNYNGFYKTKKIKSKSPQVMLVQMLHSILWEIWKTKWFLKGILNSICYAAIWRTSKEIYFLVCSVDKKCKCVNGLQCLL